MQTILTELPERAADFIRAGEVVAFPTETVYGLGANVFNETAIQKIFLAKGRTTDNPLIAHIADVDDLPKLTARITPSAKILIAHFFPGPLTIVLPKHTDVPLIATAGLETIGIRMPRHPLAAQFIKACGVPLVAPSANLSGKPSPTTWEAVVTDLAGKIACLLQGDQTEVGLESTVVDCTGTIPFVLRAGAITLEDLQQIIPGTQQTTDHNLRSRSPGQRYRHYAPQAKIVIIKNPSEALTSAAAFIGLQRPARDFQKVQICNSVEEYARALFLFFRQCDEAEIKLIFCEAVEQKGLGVALMDRIKRAAQK